MTSWWASTNPRNTSSPFNTCTGLAGFGSANPSSVLQGEMTTLTVYVAPAQDPTSTGITVTADLTQIGGSPTQPFSGSGNTFTYVATIPANNPTGMKSLPVTIADAQSRTASTNIVLSVLPLIPDHVTISQLYGGGGNTGATYSHDFVELYNPYTATFDLTGWSLQYSSATGTTWQVQPLGGTIAPGEYYLIGLAAGTVPGATPLPPANVNGDINLSGTTGKVALVNNFDALEGPCPLGNPGIVDFLGYGTTANCAETTRAAAPSNTTSLFRQNGGARDTDNNFRRLLPGAPNPRRTAPIVEIGPSVFGTDPRNGSTSAPRDATIDINFTEPVTVDPGWYDITCVSTGNHNSATVRSFFGGDTHTITPNVNFLAGEQCTVTIFKDAIHDVDTDDSGANSDSLPANKVFTFTVATGTAPPYPSSVHLTMGNPNASAPSGDNNYLIDKPELSLSYNRARGTANWVSWHLTDEWIGTLTRVDTFRADPEVPADWFRVSEFDYVGSGFDRGHMVPNADRDKETSVPINQATFLMTNMIPQSPDNNQGPWASLEGYFRTLLPANEIYIIAGGVGTGGTGSAGPATHIAGGNVTVPAQTWKVALVLSKASGDDVSRVNCSTRTVAVIMPNIQGIRNDLWENYLTTVDAVEALTTYDFFSNLPEPIQRCVEAGTNGNNPPLDTDNDGDPDTTDPDDDNDTFSDTDEVAAGSDPLNANSTPEVCDGVDNDLNDGIDEGFTNTDGDGQADCVDADDDNDTFSDTDEVAAGSDPLNANSTPEVCDGVDNDLNDGIDEGFTNTDGDGQADCVDADDDNDTFSDTDEVAAGSDPLNANSTPEVCDGVDNDLNDGIDEGFTNTDGDGQADCVDADDDNDGQTDADELACGSDSLSASSKALDTDGDNSPDCVDSDDDNDGVVDTADNCPFTANSDQLDTDGDGFGNVCDFDDDGDGVLDSIDNCSLVANSNQADFDGDGIGDVCDPETGPPANKDQCKDDGWQRFDVPRRFNNQGDCIQYVNTGK